MDAISTLVDLAKHGIMIALNFSKRFVYFNKIFCLKIFFI